ncbi:MAG: amino acid adenylation domain-containing protein, partial [Rhizobium sp.]|nr:amino acid adenylation domain-containing protein [Rhizobium sp.]
MNRENSPDFLVNQAGIYPLTDAQRGIWLRSKSNPRAGQAYQLPFAIRLHGDLDTAAMEAAIHDLLRWNDGLRSSFPIDHDGNPYCRIAPESHARAGFQFIDLLGNSDAAQQVTALAEEDWRTPFDLEIGPLVRARLVREARDCHTLLLTAHHIVVDGPSLIQLSEQLASLYNYRVGHAEAPGPAPSMAEYAVVEATSREAREASISFWSETLAGARSLHDIPTDRPRPRTEDPTAGFMKFGFNREETARIRACARQANGTLFTVLLASWAVLMARLSRDDYAVIGVPFSRHSKGAKAGLVGCLIDLLPVRVPYNPEMRVSELLAATRSSVRQAAKHAALPLDQIMAAAEILTSPTHHPVFQSSFSMPRPVERIPSFAGLRISAIDVSISRAMVDEVLDPDEHAFSDYSCALVAGTTTPSTTKMDLSILLLESAGCIHGGIEYATTLWNESTIRMMADCWRHLALSMSQRIDQRIADIDWHPNCSGSTCRSMATVARQELEFAAQPLRRWARQMPDADAIVSGNLQISFSSLDKYVDALAAGLQLAGVHRCSRVAFVGGRSMTAVAIMFAAFRNGATFVPLDETIPPERLARILEDCDPALVIGEQSHAMPFQSRWMAAGSIARWPETSEAGCASPLPEPQDWRNLPAYIIYTSGSTGHPKGVEVGHEALALCSTTISSFCDSQPKDRVLQAASIGFDAFILEVLMSIFRGACLCIPQGTSLVGEALGQALDEFGITHALLTPTALSSLERSNFPKLRTLLSGAEPLGGDLARKWAKGRRLFNCYGPTEATIIATAMEIPEEMPGDPAIGYVLGQHTGYVLDPNGHPVPPGVVGELHLAGRGLANGYVGSKLLTDERFLANPFHPDAAPRMYRTGDLVRVRQDGTLQFCGRNDSQVKIHGLRIEPLEVEGCIASLPGVKAVRVRVIDTPSGRRLAAYVAARDDMDSAYIRAHARRQLPAYMVPSHIIMMANLPLLPSGKLDHRALPPPQADEERDIAPPRGRTEETLCALWSQLLGVPRIGRDDHFFDLGGHSLLAVRVVSRVRQDL